MGCARDASTGGCTAMQKGEARVEPQKAESQEERE